jgi:anti-sigma factor RsiW
MNGDCRQVRELMDSYISGELTVESNHDVLRHVERCDACRSELERRERLGALLIAGAGVWFSRPVDAAAFDDSVDDHIACAMNYPPFVVYDAARAARNLEPAYQPIVDAVAHRAGDYQLIDAHMCPYQGRNYAHMVYRGNGKMLSVFAETASRGRLPLLHESPRKGFVTEGTSARGHQVFVVSDHAAGVPGAVVSDLMHSTLAFVTSLER